MYALETERQVIRCLDAGCNDAIGAYDKKVRREINTIVDKQEYRKLMDYVKITDPKAFVTVYSVNEICYMPKK